MNDQSINPLPTEWVDRIFQKLTGRFGRSFVEKFSSCDASGFDEGMANAKGEWGEVLGGFSGDDIKRGLAADYKFPPSCDEFKIACRPSVHADGRPSALEAWTMLPKREEHTRLVTDEMDRAAEGIGELIASGNSTDLATAKAVYIERYDSIVKLQRELGIKAVWRVSRGTDSPRDAIANGLLKGVLAFDYCLVAFHPEEVEAAIEIVKMKAKPEDHAVQAMLASPKVLALAPPPKSAEERESSKQKAIDAKNAIMGMLNRHKTIDDGAWVDDGLIDPRGNK